MDLVGIASVAGLGCSSLEEAVVDNLAVDSPAVGSLVVGNLVEDSCKDVS